MTPLAPITLHLFKFVTNSQCVQKLWNHLLFDSWSFTNVQKLLFIFQSIGYATELSCAILDIVTLVINYYMDWQTHLRV